MPRVDGLDLRLDPLTVAAGVQLVLDIVLAEHGQRRNGVGDRVVGRMQGFDAQVIAGRGNQ